MNALELKQRLESAIGGASIERSSLSEEPRTLVEKDGVTIVGCIIPKRECKRPNIVEIAVGVTDLPRGFRVWGLFETVTSDGTPRKWKQRMRSPYGTEGKVFVTRVNPCDEQGVKLLGFHVSGWAKEPLQRQPTASRLTEESMKVAARREPWKGHALAGH